MAKAGRKHTPLIVELPKELAKKLAAEAAQCEAKAAEAAEARKLIDDEISGRNLARQIAREIATATPPKSFGATAAWIEAEAKRLKAAGDIREGIRITDFAKLLEQRMREAAKANKSLRPVGWRHIKNNLPDWGLWPISFIK